MILACVSRRPLSFKTSGRESGELLRASWAQIGVTFELRKYPSPLFFAPARTGGIIYGGKYDATIYAWILGPNADLTNLFACDRIPPNGANVPRYCDREVDRARSRIRLVPRFTRTPRLEGRRGWNNTNYSKKDYLVRATANLIAPWLWI